MNKFAIPLLTILIFSLLIGCDSITSIDESYLSPNSNNSGNDLPAVILNNGASTDDFPFDQYEIIHARVIKDTLYFKVSYSGGCNDHDFRLVANNYFMESFPVQVGLFLSHEDFDDACDAIITEELYFDLSPLKDEYYNSYGNSTDPIILNILTDLINNKMLQLVYQPSAYQLFSFESTADTLGWDGITEEMFLDDPPQIGGGRYLYIGGGCLQPAASKEILITEEGSYSISCWGKTNYNGGSIVLKSDDEEISINISSKSWQYYNSYSVITCGAGTRLSLEIWVGGIVFDDLFCDELVIRKL
ncbi:hypothetical protein ACFLTH_11780 [Bacteroidota bacterium]